MLFFCLKYGKNVESKNLMVEKTKNGRMMLLSNCAVCSNLYKSKK